MHSPLTRMSLTLVTAVAMSASALALAVTSSCKTAGSGSNSRALVQGSPEDAAPVATRAFVGARLLPISAAPIEDGVLVVRDGKIAAIGARSEVDLPSDAEIVDATGRTIMPGLICTHSHAGSPSGGDKSHPIQPETRALDAIDVTKPSIQRARAGGLTTLNIMPGSGHLISGQTVYVKLRRGQTIEDLAYQFPDGSPMGGLKMANGTNSQGDAPFPGTRAKSAALVRQKYIKAQEYAAKLERAAASDDVDAPARDLALEALVEAMEGKRIVHHHTHRHDDILTVLRMAKEFGFRVVLHHVSEGWRVADQIAEAGVPCSAIVVDSPGGKPEATRLQFDTCRILDDAGVRVALHTDDYITDARLFLRSAALAVRAGLSRERALEAVTIAGAEMLDLADRIGTLEVGKDADLCLLDGDPLSVYTHVVETWVEGERVFDLTDAEDRVYSVGGAGAGDDVPFTDCCANVR